MVWDSIIEETQSEFMSGRRIMNNIRLVLNIILFLDFYKAYNTVKHLFLLQLLKKFVFGNYFSTAIKTVIVLLN